MNFRRVVPMRTAKIGTVSVSLALCALGIFLIACPNVSVAALGVICGALMIAFGVVRLVGYFSKDLYRLAFQYDLATGILLVALGCVLLVHPGGLLNFLCVALGLFILADGLFKIQIAVDSKRFGLKEWWLILTVALVTGAFGMLLMLRPAGGSKWLMILFGVSLLFEGILNLCTALTAVKIVKHQQPDCIEVEYTEVQEDGKEKSE